MALCSIYGKIRSANIIMHCADIIQSAMSSNPSVDYVGNIIRPSRSGVEVSGVTFLLSNVNVNTGIAYAYSAHIREQSATRFQIWRQTTPTSDRDFLLISELFFIPSVVNQREDADASAAEVSLMSETIILILLIWLAVVTFFLFVVFIVVCCLCRRRSDDQKFRQSSAYGEYMNSYNNTLSKPTGHANGQMDEIPETNGDVNGKTPEKAIPRGLHISRTDSSDSFGWMGSMREDETAEYSVDTVQRMNSKRLAARHGGEANIGMADEQDNRLSVSKEELNNY
ncbi:hypothetical protein CAPTEDRAFT_218084 [Capitella teleta]|uniref:Uncharacterized protein n=1 Tax=Capitella teleta TaxID=283909 RepID=R7VE74_CAPTE|nr:hypothetical protein CAPTEDRAFT_218084 [Capitella teleta]|eukprot:ELU17133.1 hypothetical protein CAPTEDRAFT_218084 [Capitella teleta]